MKVVIDDNRPIIVEDGISRTGVVVIELNVDDDDNLDARIVTQASLMMMHGALVALGKHIDKNIQAMPEHLQQAWHEMINEEIEIEDISRIYS